MRKRERENGFGGGSIGMDNYLSEGVFIGRVLMIMVYVMGR